MTTPINLALQQFFSRYLGFSAAKVALLIGKSGILILAYSWLPTAEFALLAGTVSLIEILRPLSDMGAENIIYSRLGNLESLIPRMIQKLLRLRIQVAGVISLIGVIGFAGFGYSQVAPLFLLPLIVALQNTSLAFLQKICAYRKISFLTVIALGISASSVLAAYLMQANNLLLSLLLICPELAACLVGVVLSRTIWRVILLSATNKKGSIKKLLPYVLPSMGIGLMVMIYSRLDIIYIRPVLGAQAQADFSVALRLVDPIFLILSLASLTLLTELGSNNSPKAKALSLGLLKKMGIKFYIVFFAIFFILAANLYYLSIHTLNFSPEAASLLVVFALTIPIKLLNTFYSALLQRAGKFNLIFIAAMMTLFWTFSFAITFGMFYGVIGVAVASLLAELINMLYQKKIARKILGGF